MKKICPDCKKEKPVADFNSQGKYCKECHNARSRKWRSENSDKNKESQISYRNRCRNVKKSGRKTLICQKCKQRKPIDSFHWINKEEGVKSFVCRDCTSDSRKKSYGNNRVEYVHRNRQRQSCLRLDNTRRILEYLQSHPCVDCGESRPLRLSFDHVRGKKEFTIANHYLLAITWDRLCLEIQKCDVRCHNCHNEKTAVEQKRLMWKVINGLV